MSVLCPEVFETGIKWKLFNPLGTASFIRESAQGKLDHGLDSRSRLPFYEKLQKFVTGVAVFVTGPITLERVQ